MPVGVALPETPLVLDTDVLTDWRYQKPYVQQAVSSYISRAKRPPALTSVNVFELLYGFENKAAKALGLDERTSLDRQSTEQLIRSCTVLAFDGAAFIAAYVFARMSRSDRSKHWQDILIAATALAHGHGYCNAK